MISGTPSRGSSATPMAASLWETMPMRASYDGFIGDEPSQSARACQRRHRPSAGTDRATMPPLRVAAPPTWLLHMRRDVTRCRRQAKYLCSGERRNVRCGTGSRLRRWSGCRGSRSLRPAIARSPSAVKHSPAPCGGRCRPPASAALLRALARFLLLFFFLLAGRFLLAVVGLLEALVGVRCVVQGLDGGADGGGFLS
jgi:hypothetical protein